MADFPLKPYSAAPWMEKLQHIPRHRLEVWGSASRTLLFFIYLFFLSNFKEKNVTLKVEWKWVVSSAHFMSVARSLWIQLWNMKSVLLQLTVELLFLLMMKWNCVKVMFSSVLICKCFVPEIWKTNFMVIVFPKKKKIKKKKSPLPLIAMTTNS